MEVRSYFENHKSVIDEELGKAKESVVIAVAWINFKEYFDSFHSLLERNVKVQIVCSDNFQNRAHLSVISSLKEKKAQIRLLGMPSINNHMHHKFCVIDGMTIINGSFNWSPNATKSFENVMVIKDCPREAKKFIGEFNKLVKIETKSIKKLQKKTKCKVPGCQGELHNILVFSERCSKYYELYGDVIQLCDTCNNFEAIISCISNNSLVILLEEYTSAQDDYECEYLYDAINAELESYMNKETIIHSVGRVYTGLDGFDNDYTETNIIWKNKFVGNKVRDKYDDENFDVLYDSTFEI